LNAAIISVMAAKPKLMSVCCLSKRRFISSKRWFTSSKWRSWAVKRSSIQCCRDSCYFTSTALESSYPSFSTNVIMTIVLSYKNPLIKIGDGVFCFNYGSKFYVCSATKLCLHDGLRVLRLSTGTVPSRLCAFFI